MALTLYFHPQSRAVMTRWLLEEIGVPYALEPVAFDDGSMRAPEFLALNPMGKIPVVTDGDVVITETMAIAIYLADKYKQPNDLAPAIDAPERGEYLRWIAFQGAGVEAAMTQKSAGVALNRMQAGWGDFDLVVDVLKSRLSQAGPYLLGERFSAADVVLGGALDFAVKFQIFPDAPDYAGYLDRLRSRPAYQRVMPSG